MSAAQLGNFGLAGALLAAAGAMLACIAAARLNRPHLLGIARWLLYAATGLLALCTILLAKAILANDFSLVYVSEYSDRVLPKAYKLSAVWAGQAGSLLLWAGLAAVAASLAAGAIRRDPPARQAATISILAAVCGFLVAVTLFAASPFRLNHIVPEDGQGLNPMLQNAGMIFHPPVLFLGYAGFGVPFALFMGGLLGGQLDGRLLGYIRRWVLVSWLFLTAGILLGAQWAYVELGWGGYWAWDPVENASLLPWFTATALIHSLIACQRHGAMKTFSAVLVSLTFLLCIFGTYLTRSGVIASVHAFSRSPVGTFFLVFLGLLLVGSVLVILRRRALLVPRQPMQRLLSQEGAILAGNVLAVLMMLATLVGTIFPLLTAPFSAAPMSVKPAFYNTLVLPMGLALVTLMGLAPALNWSDAKGARLRLLTQTLAAHAAGVLAGLHWGRNPWVICTAFACAWVVTAIITNVAVTAWQWNRQDRSSSASFVGVHGRRLGGYVTHLGVVMLVLGVAGSSLFSLRQEWEMEMGRPVQLGGYSLRADSVREVQQANYNAVEATVTMTDREGLETVLRPQKRFYNAQDEQSSSEVAIDMGLREDVYLTLLGWKDQGKSVTLQAIINPLVSWIWIGGVAMGLGCLVCLLRRSPAVKTVAQVSAVELVEVEQ